MARAARLSAAIRTVMWPQERLPYASPVEHTPTDELADLPAETFFADMPPIVAGRG